MKGLGALEVQIIPTETLILLAITYIIVIIITFNNYNSIINLKEELKNKYQSRAKYSIWSTIILNNQQHFLVTSVKCIDDEHYYTLVPCGYQNLPTLCCNERTLDYIKTISSSKKEEVETDGR